MSDKFQDRTMAFAGICQAAYLVQKVARDGTCDEASLHESLQSVLVTDPKQPLEVFGNHLAIRDGYRALVEQLGSDGSQKNAELTRYVVSLIALERKLAKRKDILNMLGERISQIGRQQQHFDLLDEQILANMASIYSDLISPIGPRIQIAGTPLFLQQPLVQHKVRALLLAGIRACVLWRQLGGSRTQIIFARKKMVELAKRF
ncbi:TPA: high frequency lysogenization protein HflD [Aeromonas salmonicida]|uniref:high frequency lysogenization protein HflD n=1 Tax=Aeromonas salmonicida TaxID=645 RepID=UPI0004515F8D|nr:high frequency lysogenization protein HflD [Aeromonas salmonicida]ASI24022.1 lysogenization protein HflD [Aeromonas salmonicida]ASI28340.1 lysogenization protein HflD [Aeromonas salmonicida]ASI32471.1 lysogenization protein HflD [Aeromonas salmonicida]ATD38414.1 lysogenization regulator HflD [Aeromonas salmonicida subsp. masoucida]ELI6407105.1 high frequency lysogenization protein HflD [Aeromonas salmonicida subsp. salmonicida]